jgi:streptomycin 6-kinase
MIAPPPDLDAIVARACRAWSLEIAGPPFPGAQVSFVLPVRRADGSDAVLKVQFPHRECVHEAAALRCWDGNGAVRLLDHDAGHHALLLERCVPGDHLAAVGGPAALDALVDMMPRLWIPATAPFDTLADEAGRWGEHLADPESRAGAADDLVDIAIGLLRDLAASATESVLLHQDLHAENVLAATREPWLAIDPKPLVGDRAFSAAPVVRSSELGTSRSDVFYRLDRLCGDLDLDRSRAIGWTVAQTVAWRVDSTQPAWGDQLVRWLLEA